ncbi:MAG: hypothetical protein Q8R55_05740 [Candidatus Taylorbacteria bacterium]|nr:hypothetical protein [Candidatus Taylorbacteria bacterium]
MEEQFPKQALDKFRQWHFWWLVVFSFLLIITFVYYLPAMFLNQSMILHDAVPMGIPIDESKLHGHDPSGTSMPNTSPTATSGAMMSPGPVMTSTSEHAIHGGVAYHEEGDAKDGLVVNLNISPVPYNVGDSLKMDFFVNQKPGNLPVPASNLEINHTKKIHVVGLRSDMNEFFHIHPKESQDNEALFTINHTFNKPGLYKIWSDVKKDGTSHVFGHPEVNVNGEGSREEKQVSFSRNVTVNNYQVSLVTDGTVVKARGVVLTFDIHTLTGQEITVENYLDAQMHLVLIKDDWKQFIHAHPAGAANDEHSFNNIISTVYANGNDDHGTPSGGTPSGDEVITFNATFPEAGLYKTFAQFRPQGIDLPADEAITAEFWLQVEEKAPFPVSQWWGLLLVSVLLIAGLSWWVKKYLVVKPEDVKINKS